MESLLSNTHAGGASQLHKANSPDSMHNIVGIVDNQFGSNEPAVAQTIQSFEPIRFSDPPPDELAQGIEGHRQRPVMARILTNRYTEQEEPSVKKHAALAFGVLTALAGCLSPSADSEEVIGEAEQEQLGFVPDPVGVWTFDNCTGNVVPNELDGPDATLYNGAWCDAGYEGGAGYFDGVNDRAEVPHDSSVSFTNAMTVSAWVNPEGISAPQTIVGKWYAPDSYLLSLSNGTYRFSVALAGGVATSVAAPATASTWTHVAGVFNGAEIKIYLNGKLHASAPAMGTLQSSYRPVTIGNHPTWNPFKGKIDKVVLYNVDYSVSAPSRCFPTCLGCDGKQCCKLLCPPD